MEEIRISKAAAEAATSEIRDSSGYGFYVQQAINSECGALSKEIKELQDWKCSMLKYCERWDNTDGFVRNHPNVLVGADIPALTLCWLKQRDQLIEHVKELGFALTMITDRYTALVTSGDCGNWDPETEPSVMQARQAIQKAQP